MLRRPISYQLSEKGIEERQTRQRRRSQRILLSNCPPCRCNSNTRKVHQNLRGFRIPSKALSRAQIPNPGVVRTRALGNGNVPALLDSRTTGKYTISSPLIVQKNAFHEISILYGGGRAYPKYLGN